MGAITLTMDEETPQTARGGYEPFFLNEFGFEVAHETENETNSNSANHNSRASTAKRQKTLTKTAECFSDSLGVDPIERVDPSSKYNQSLDKSSDSLEKVDEIREVRGLKEDHQSLESSSESLGQVDPIAVVQPTGENHQYPNKDTVVDSTESFCHPNHVDVDIKLSQSKTGTEANASEYLSMCETPEIVVSDCSGDQIVNGLECDSSDDKRECSECSSQSFFSLHPESSKIGNETTLAARDCIHPIDYDNKHSINSQISTSVEQPISVARTNQEGSEDTPGHRKQEFLTQISIEANKHNEGGTKILDSEDFQSPLLANERDIQTNKPLFKVHLTVQHSDEEGSFQKPVRRLHSEDSHSSGPAEEDGETIVMAGEPPDGGYGWVIVFAMFIISVVHPSVATCFGLVLAQIQEETGGDLYTNSQLVWIPTILFALRQLLAPASGRLAELFGIRVVSCTGGLLLSLGLMLSAFSDLRLGSLYLSYGCVMGIGLTLLVPQTVLITQSYFTSKRVAALAVGSMGVSLGSLTMPLLLQWLLTTYGVEATFLLWSGITLQTVVTTLLFHPIKRHLKAKPIPLKNIRSNQMLMPLRRRSSTGIRRGSKCNCESNVCESMLALGSMLPNRSHLGENAYRTSLSDTLEVDEILKDEDRSFVKEISCFSPIKVPCAENRLSSDEVSQNNLLERTWSNPAVDSSKPPSKKSLNRVKSSSERDLEVLPVILEERSDTEGGSFPLQSSHEDVSKSNLRPKRAGISHSRPTSRNSGRSMDSFATCRDSFETCRTSAFSDSVYCSLEILPTQLDGQSVSSKAQGNKMRWKQRICSMRKRLPSLQIVRQSIGNECHALKVSYSEVLSHKVFIISCVSSCLSRLVYTNFNTFLPLVGEEVGLKDSKVYLLIAVAALDLVAKILTAILSTCTNVSTQTLYVTGSVVSTMACFGVSISQGLTTLLISSGLFGLGLGIQMSTSAVLLVEFLGMRLLAKSFGLSLFFVGTTGLALMPLGGALQDAVGNYRSTYYFLTVFAAGPALMWTLGLRLVKWMDGERELPGKKKKRQWFNQTDPLSK